MRVVAIEDDGSVALVERPDPQPAGDFVVAKVTVAPTCTEYKAYARRTPGARFGHEAMGEVVAVAQPGRVRMGDRVVVMPLYACGTCPLCLSGEYIHCQRAVDVAAATGSASGTATYAQYLVKQDWMLVPVPEDVSDEHASMACCGLGPTFGAMQRMRVGALDTLLITGMGPVGLGGVINGVHRGARVFAVESHPYRQQLAADLGAEAVFDPRDAGTPAAIVERAGGAGVDCGIDCSGAPEARRLLIDAARRRGQVAFVGEGGDLTLDVSRDLLRKGLTLHGSWHYNLADTPAIMKVIRAVPGQIDRLITHRFPMSRVQEAWELQITGACGKVLLDPWR